MGILGFEALDNQKSPEAKSSASWVDELFDRREHTVGGYAVGLARDLFDRGPKIEALKEASARSNDEMALIAADTVAFMPSLRWTAGGALRAAILIDPTSGLADNAQGFGKNFLEGAALNKVGKLAAPESAVMKLAGGRFGKGVLTESIGHLSVGVGMGAVKTGFHAESWKDRSGDFSLAAGLENVAKGSAIAAAVNLPAGMLGVRITKAATVGVADGTMSTRVAGLIQGAGSGYGSGVVFGALDGIAQGKGVGDILAEMHKGGLVGAFTGGFVHGVEASRVRAPLPESIVRRAVIGEEPRGFAVERVAPRKKDAVERDPVKPEPTAWTSEKLDIPYKPATREQLLEARGRLINGRIENYRMVHAREGVVGPFKSYKDFERRALTPADEPMRIYDVVKHSTKILISETYAQQLDLVRALRDQHQAAQAAAKGDGVAGMRKVKESLARLEAHPLKDRALPEDFVVILDELPDRSLVRRLFILDRADPLDAWTRQEYKPDFSAAAEASDHGDITFFKPQKYAGLRDYMFHEWAHLVKFKFGESSWLFDRAARFEEKDGYFVSEYSRRNDHENFAVHFGEEFLNWDADHFASLTDSAPLRSAIFGRALVETFAKTPAWARSEHHPQYMERIKHAQEHILPRAQEILVERINNGDRKTKIAALELLTSVGSERQLDMLKTLATKSRDAEVAEEALEAGYAIARSDARRLNFLMAVGGRDSLVHDIAVDRLQRLRDPRAATYWKLLDWSGKKEHLQDLVHLVGQMQDVPGREMAYDAAWKLATDTSNTRVMGSLLNQAPDPGRREAAFRYLLDRMTHGPEERARMAVQALENRPDLRLTALEVLAAAKMPFTEPAVSKFVGDRNPEVARLARSISESIQASAEIGKIVARARHGAESSRVEAMHQLGERGDIKGLDAILEGTASPNIRVRAASLEALKHFSPTLVKFQARQFGRSNPPMAAAMRVIIEGGHLRG